MKSYVEEWYTGRRMTVVGVGVSHDELVKHAEASLSSIPEGMTTTDEQCEYVGGKNIGHSLHITHKLMVGSVELYSIHPIVEQSYSDRYVQTKGL